jgi:hypothetical protein
MNTSTAEDLTKQLGLIKKETVRLKRMLLLVLLVVIVVVPVLSGSQLAGRDRILEAEQFLLLGKDKRVLAKLFANEENLPRLNFYDKDGTCRVKIDVLALDAGLFITDPIGQVHASLSTNPGASHLYLGEPGGKRVSLATVCGVKPDQYAELDMGDSDGPSDIQVTDHCGWSSIRLLGAPLEKNGGASEYLRLSADINGSSDITMFDKRQVKRFAVNTDSDGRASIDLFDAKQDKMIRVPNP